MSVQQISVFLENKPGAFSAVAKVLSGNGVNLRAMSVADTAEFGILRIIVDNVEKTKEVLKDGGFIYKETPVIAVEVEDRPGSLVRILDTLEAKNVSLEYMYAFITRKTESAYLVFRVDDTERTAAILSEAGIRVADSEDLSSL